MLVAEPRSEEACIAKDADDSGAVLQCAAADISGGFAASMASCIGREVTLDEGFDLSTLNSASENCRYNPGYKAFCRIDQTAGGTGKCRKIYGMMNFFYPREPPPMIEQVIQLGAVFLRDPVSPSLIESILHHRKYSDLDPATLSSLGLTNFLFCKY